MRHGKKLPVEKQPQRNSENRVCVLEQDFAFSARVQSFVFFAAVYGLFLSFQIFRTLGRAGTSR